GPITLVVIMTCPPVFRVNGNHSSRSRPTLGRDRSSPSLIGILRRCRRTERALVTDVRLHRICSQQPRVAAADEAGAHRPSCGFGEGGHVGAVIGIQRRERGWVEYLRRAEQ